jgi:hypothetical protein
MPPNHPRIVTVRIRQANSLGGAMKRIRLWLDDQKIQTTTFTTAADAKGYTFTIGFRSNEDASHFRRQFSDTRGPAHRKSPASAEGFELSN